MMCCMNTKSLKRVRRGAPCKQTTHVSVRCWQQGPTCGTALALDTAVCLQPLIMLCPANRGQSCWSLAKRIAARGVWQLTVDGLPHILFVPVLQGP